MFKIPDIIEFIESIRRPAGGFATEPGWGEIMATTTVPMAIVTTPVRPPNQVYAYIMYHISFSASMVPDAFRVILQHTGRDSWTGLVSPVLIGEGFTFYMVVTSNDPLVVVYRDETPQVQYFQMFYHYALVRPADYNLVLTALADKANVGGLRDAQKLLALMGPFVTKAR